MQSLTELESIINEFNARQQSLQQGANVAENEAAEKMKKFIAVYKIIKNKDIKPNIIRLILCLNKAIGIRAKVDYSKKFLEPVGIYEGIEIDIARDNNSSLSIKISPNIYKEDIGVNIDRNPGFGADKKLEIPLKDFTSVWLNDLVINEFRKFIE
ncbi:MAG: hypothetical protein ACXWEY_03890 [Bacteroidia bacterium]